MDNDDSHLEAELHAFLDHEQSIELESDSIGHEVEADRQEQFKELLKLADEMGVTIPRILPTFEEDIQRIKEINEGERTDDSTTTDRLLLDIADELISARVFAGDDRVNNALALERRNRAIQMLLKSELSEHQKTQLVNLTNGFLKGFVDPLNLPTDEVGREMIIMEPEFDKSIERKNDDIKKTVADLLMEELAEKYGLRDDTRELSRWVTSIAGIFCGFVQSNMQPEKIAPEIQEWMNHSGINKLFDSHGIDHSVGLGLIVFTAKVMDKFGYIGGMG